MHNFKTFLLIFLLLVISGCSFQTDHVKKSPAASTPAPAGNSAVNTPGLPSPTNQAALSLTVIPSTAPSAAAAASSSISQSIAPAPTGIASSINGPEGIILDILRHMSLDEKVGQMFFVRCNQDSAALDIKKYKMGGFILFSNDFKGKTKKEVTSTFAAYQKLSKIPLLIGVDEEGGIVNRISKYPAFRTAAFQSPQKLYRLGGYPLLKADTIDKANFLKSLGINVNLAPVSDVSIKSTDFIYPRSFGKNAKETSLYVKTVVTAMKAAGIGSTLKHFPGYGNNKDTHTGSAIDTRKISVFEKSDFLPFRAGIAAGADSILVSHNIVTCMDKHHPASLSAPVHSLLRKSLGFTGVIMTDDLSMDAITEFAGKEKAAVLAVTAGNDLIISSNCSIQLPAVIEAVKSKKISEERINLSVKRILLWKLSLGLIKK